VDPAHVSPCEIHRLPHGYGRPRGGIHATGPAEKSDILVARVPALLELLAGDGRRGIRTAPAGKEGAGNGAEYFHDRHGALLARDERRNMERADAVRSNVVPRSMRRIGLIGLPAPTPHGARVCADAPALSTGAVRGSVARPKQPAGRAVRACSRASRCHGDASVTVAKVWPSSLSDLKNRSENLTGRSQISSILKGNSSSTARESGGIWIVQADLQPISFKSDRLLDPRNRLDCHEPVGLCRPPQPLYFASSIRGGRAMGDISVLLQRACGGDQGASDQLLTALYADLRKLAARRLQTGSGDGLHCTSLVHEAYFRLAKPKALADRAHFFGVARCAMRQLVLGHARQRKAGKRAGIGRRDESLHALDDAALPETLRDTHGTDVFALDQALPQLAVLDPQLPRLVEMRFFAGMELSEIAKVLQRSERSLKRDWRKARAFWHAHLHESDGALELP